MLLLRRSPEVLDECDISADVKEKLLEDIRKKLTPQAVKVSFNICQTFLLVVDSR